MRTDTYIYNHTKTHTHINKSTPIDTCIHKHTHTHTHTKRDSCGVMVVILKRDSVTRVQILEVFFVLMLLGKI